MSRRNFFETSASGEPGRSAVEDALVATESAVIAYAVEISIVLVAVAFWLYSQGWTVLPTALGFLSAGLLIESSARCP